MNVLLRFERVAPAALVLAVILATLATGCSSPSSTPVLLTLPPARTLGNAAASAPVSALAPAPMLAVRRVEIPEYLVARRVRYRADAATLAEWPNTYWAERIEIGVSRELVAALRQQLPDWQTCDIQCGDQTPARLLHVTLMPMDYMRGTRVLKARARIAVSGAAAPVKVSDISEITFDIPSDADTPQAHAQAITTLIEKVAAAAAPMVHSAKP